MSHTRSLNPRGWFPPWVILASVAILAPIFIFWTVENIQKQKEQMILLLLEKGEALIRSFEAGARTGMMGMMGTRAEYFQLQRLLMETAQVPDIVHLIVTDPEGTVLAHSDPSRIGGAYAPDLDLEEILRTKSLYSRRITPEGTDASVPVFEVFRTFTPTKHIMRKGSGVPRQPRWSREFPGGREPPPPDPGKIIFVGLDTLALEQAQWEDLRHTIIMGAILLLIVFAGMGTLFLAHAYRTARFSLSRIKAFSDNVVENMPIGLVAVNPEGKIASFNQAAESMMGIEGPDALGTRVEDILPGDLRAFLQELETRKGPLVREMEGAFKGKGAIPLDVSASILTGEDGTHWGSLLLFRDLTEVEELKREVERSHRLASLGRLAAGVAHEIRNPLSSIKGFATYFRDRYREFPEDQATATIMIQEVDRLNRVITQLLDFARPMEIQKRPSPIQPVIQHALKMIEAEAEERGIRIETDLSPAVPPVPLDPDRMNQVLLNLALNALEATGAGGSLSVRLREDGSRGRIALSVSDTGRGIRKKDLAHIFDPYFTTRQSGTGLGLAIVHKIIESHGGEIRVESEEGKGTTVTVFLPLK